MLKIWNFFSAKPTEDEYVEDVVCKDGDVRENEMKVFDLKDAGKVLLVRQNGKLNALGTKCSHYGAPLDKGALGEGRIRCQWHGACFNITTGDIEDFPGGICFCIFFGRVLIRFLILFQVWIRCLVMKSR